MRVRQPDVHVHDDWGALLPYFPASPGGGGGGGAALACSGCLAKSHFPRKGVSNRRSFFLTAAQETSGEHCSCQANTRRAVHSDCDRDSKNAHNRCSSSNTSSSGGGLTVVWGNSKNMVHAAARKLVDATPEPGLATLKRP